MRKILPIKLSVKLIAFVTSLTLGVNAFSQLTTAAVTAPNAVNNLLGAGLNATNVQYSGAASQIRSFQCNGCNLGLPSGIIMSTGRALTAEGPNNTGEMGNANFNLDVMNNSNTPDADLNQIYGGVKRDLCKLEFDFVPMGDSFVFEFVFGSDEYPEYAIPSEADFNDVFGFFLSGPGINGPFSNNSQNLAVIPGTGTPGTYVSIQTLNNGVTGINGPCVNCAHYTHNGTGYNASHPSYSNNSYIQADGFTTVLQVKAYVQCGQTYHIKMALADNGDPLYNSWVFLKEGSFQSAFDLAFDIPGISDDNSVREGCGTGALVVSRPCGMEGDLTVNLTYSGTAINGSDYTEMPSSAMMNADEDSVTISFNALNDSETEPTETVIITATMGIITGSTTLNIIDTPLLNATVENQLVPCNEDATLTAAITGGSGNTTVEWTGVGTGNPFIIENPTDQTIAYVITDACDTGNPVSGEIEVTLQQYQPVVVSLGEDINATCNQTETLTPAVSGGDGNYSYVWSNGTSNIGTDPSITVSAQTGIVFTATVTDGCGTSASDGVEFIIAPQPIEFSLGQGPLSTTCLQPVYFEPEITGGTGNYNYAWTVNGTATGNTTVHTAQVNSTSVVTLTVTDECGGQGYEEITILVPPVPVVISNLPDLTVPCFGLFTVNSSVTGGVGSYSYNWNANGETLGTGASLSTSVAGQTTINLTVADQCGNHTTESFNVSLNPSNLSVEIFADDLDVCPDEDVLLTTQVDQAIGSINYAWNVQGAAGSTVVVSSPSTMVYTVTITDACSFSASDSYEMVVWPSNTLVVPGDDYELCTGKYSVNMVRGGVLPYSFEYDATILNLSNNEFMSPYSNRITTITVTDHCQNSATFDVFISPCDTEIPNVFTPNNDSSNPRFVIRGIEGFPGSTLEIYNRWGNKVFESSNYRNEWAGADEEEGTYYYILKRSDGENFSGNLQLVR